MTFPNISSADQEGESHKGFLLAVLGAIRCHRREVVPATSHYHIMSDSNARQVHQNVMKKDKDKDKQAVLRAKSAALAQEEA